MGGCGINHKVHVTCDLQMCRSSKPPSAQSKDIHTWWSSEIQLSCFTSVRLINTSENVPNICIQTIPRESVVPCHMVDSLANPAPITTLVNAVPSWLCLTFFKTSLAHSPQGLWNTSIACHGCQDLEQCDDGFLS